MHEQDSTLDAVRKARREISARFDHDLGKLGEHYMDLQRADERQDTRATGTEPDHKEHAIRA